MKVITKNIFKTVFFMAASLAFAEKVTLTVDQAVQYAVENSPSLKTAEIDLDISKRSAMYGWNTILPSVSVSGVGSRANEYPYSSKMSTQSSQAIMGSLADLYMKAGDFEKAKKFADSLSQIKTDYSEESERWNYLGSVQVQWSFNIAMVDAIRASYVAYQNGQITWEQTLENTKVNVQKLFYGLLLMQENLSIQKENLSNAKARYEQALINYRNGLVPELQVLNSQVSYENQKPSVLSTEQALKQQMNSFGLILGFPYGTEIELSGKIEIPSVKVDAEELFEKYAENNRDIRSMKNNIQLLKIKLSGKRYATYTPSFVMGWGFQPVIIDSKKNWFEGGNHFDNGSLSLTLAYSNLMDLMPFSSTGQEIKNTKLQIKQAEMGLLTLMQSTEMEVHTYCDNLDKSQSNIKAMESNVQLAQKAYNSTLRAYNNGTKELLDVKDAENSLSQAKLGLMNEKINFISSLLDLESKLGVKLH